MGERIKYDQEAGRVTITLEDPVTTKNADGVVVGVISSVTLRHRCLGKDLEAMDNAEGQMGMNMHMLASLSGLSISKVRSMESPDLTLCFKVMGLIMSGKRDKIVSADEALVEDIAELEGEEASDPEGERRPRTGASS